MRSGSVARALTAHLGLPLELVLKDLWSAIRIIAMFTVLTRRAAIAGGSAVLSTSSAARAQGIGGPALVAGLTPIPRTAIHWLALFDELRKQGL